MQEIICVYTNVPSVPTPTSPPFLHSVQGLAPFYSEAWQLLEAYHGKRTADSFHERIPSLLKTNSTGGSEDLFSLILTTNRLRVS